MRNLFPSVRLNRSHSRLTRMRIGCLSTAASAVTNALKSVHSPRRRGTTEGSEVPSLERQEGVDLLKGSRQAKKLKRALPTVEETNGDRSLHLFSWAHPVRRGAARVIRQKWFEPLVMYAASTSPPRL